MAERLYVCYISYFKLYYFSLHRYFHNVFSLANMRKNLFKTRSKLLGNILFQQVSKCLYLIAFGRELNIICYKHYYRFISQFPQLSCNAYSVIAFVFKINI